MHNHCRGPVKNLSMQMFCARIGGLGTGFFALLLWAGQVEGQALQTAEGTMTVSAIGKLQVPPDMATINVSVETTGETLHPIQEANAKRVKRVVARLHQLGIREEQIQTSAFRVIPRYSAQHSSHRRDRDGPPPIIGYTVRHALTVEVQELDQVGRLIDETLAAGANRFEGLTWGLQDEHPVYLQALTLAARKARQKVETLVRALDVRFGRIVKVSESWEHDVRHPYEVAPMMRAGGQDENGSFAVASGKVIVQARVSLTVQIDHE
ncbi:MAG: DUF541 domain-containing protein [Nitrospirae bacterium]|nr:MAG: DUF541 domain-containing protein [Nitrospirota bacterium]